jgi:hypothetical protein
MRVAGERLDFTIDTRDGARPQVKVDRAPRGLELELPA